MNLDSRLPLTCPVDLLEPMPALAKLSRLPYAFMLHTARADQRSHWTFFGADPFAVFRGHDYEGAVSTWRALSDRTRHDDPAPKVAPFTGGAVGYWAYDFGRRLERLPTRAADDLELPDFILGFYDVVGAFDHRSRRAWVFSSGLPREGGARRERAVKRMEEFREWLFGPLPPPTRFEGGPRSAGSTFHPDNYRRAVEAVKDHIRRGDIFQANVSQRWTLPIDRAEVTDLSVPLFEALVAHSPSPFAAYFGAGDHAIVSASPERFLELRDRRVETRPIKGTRPRGADAAEDARLALELVASAKDRAENVMIVDVLRNDLGRVCEPGSVIVTQLCELEAFPQVYHLTSTINGRLEEGLDAFDLLHACFPGGSITGAPKIRAMEILDEIEPVRRHIYTGSLGYLDWRADADWNIAIRTALITPRAVYFSAGGGITSDSDPHAEYAETLHKAEGMRTALSALLGRVELEPHAVHAQ